MSVWAETLRAFFIIGVVVIPILYWLLGREEARVASGTGCVIGRSVRSADPGATGKPPVGKRTSEPEPSEGGNKEDVPMFSGLEEQGEINWLLEELFGGWGMASRGEQEEERPAAPSGVVGRLRVVRDQARGAEPRPVRSEARRLFVVP